MNIRFKKLVIHNFFSFGDAEIDLSISGYTLVKGINNNPSDSAISNGSGKSSWGEAILYALTGDTLRGTNSIVNLHGDDGCFVDLTFDIDNVSYQVVRYKNYSKIGTNLKFFVNGEDKSGKGIRETEKILNDYLPDINTTLIGAVIILGQGLPTKFSNNSPSGRKEVLETLSKSDFMIEDIKRKIDKRKSSLSANLREVEDNILCLKTKLNTYTSTLQKTQTQIDSIDTSRDFDDEISKISQNIEYLQQQSLESESILDNYQDKLDEINDKISLIDDDLRLSLESIRDSHRHELENLSNDIFEYQSRQQSISAKIRELESITDVCPTCGQKIPGVIKVDTSELHKELIGISNNITSLKESKLNLESSISDECLQQKSKYNSLRTLANDEKSSVVTKINELRTSKKQIDGEITSKMLELNSIKLDKSLFYDKLDSLKSTMLDCESNISRIGDDIVYIESERDKIKAKLDVESKLYSFATRDFRGILLFDIINFIQQVSEKYCESVFGNRLIQFTLDGNNIDIKYDNKYYESLSGGEKQKIDLIVQFSLREMLQRFVGFSSNIIILDEILDNIDAYGCDRVLDMIQQHLTDIDGVYIISHHSDSLAIPYDNELVIEKDATGVSRVL